MISDRSSTADLSEAESDTSSIVGDIDTPMKPPSPASREQMHKRIESLVQENRVLKMELETYKMRVKSLHEENKLLKQASVRIQAKAEQEEEFISNTLMKKIQELKREKETLALNYEQEEECLTNDLSRKLSQLRQEKAELASTLQHEQESLVNKLLRRIKKLENETQYKQTHLEQLRREKVELENTLEQEQESLVNRLWKRMDKLEAEKRTLQEKLDQPGSAPPSPMDLTVHGTGEGVSETKSLVQHIQYLRNQVTKLKQQLCASKSEHTERMQQLTREEQQIREENLRLHRKLQYEVDRREQLCRNLSESESSLEMEDERFFNELSCHGQLGSSGSQVRSRTISSPVSYQMPRSASPGGNTATAAVALNVSVPGTGSAMGSVTSSPRCHVCGSVLSHSTSYHSLLAPVAGYSTGSLQRQPLSRTQSSDKAPVEMMENGERFVRPWDPPSGSVAAAAKGSPTSQAHGPGAGMA